MAQHPTDRCPACGAERTGGLCPSCLLRLGLDGPALSVSHPSGPVATVSLGTPLTGGRVLDSLAATVGPVPRVLLRDTATGEAPSPVVQPSSPEVPDLPDGSARLQ